MLSSRAQKLHKKVYLGPKNILARVFQSVSVNFVIIIKFLLLRYQ
jgi:hypothetical protein